MKVGAATAANGPAFLGAGDDGRRGAGSDGQTLDLARNQRIFDRRRDKDQDLTHGQRRERRLAERQAGGSVTDRAAGIAFMLPRIMTVRRESQRTHDRNEQGNYGDPADLSHA